jgi:hypothetical protein
MSTPREKVTDLMRQTLAAARDEKQRARANLVNEIAIEQGALAACQQSLGAKQSTLLELDAELGEIDAQLNALGSPEVAR